MQAVFRENRNAAMIHKEQLEELAFAYANTLVARPRKELEPWQEDYARGFKAGATSMRNSIVEWLRSEQAAQSDSLQCSDDYADEIEKRFL